MNDLITESQILSPVDVRIRPIVKVEQNGGIKDFEHTDGFSKLSQLQQKIIRASLLISARAFRKTDPASAAAIDLSPTDPLSDEPIVLPKEDLEDPRVGYTFKPEERKYRQSQNHISNQYCHTAIIALEQEKLVTNNYTDEPEKTDKNFFHAEYYNLRTHHNNRLGYLKDVLQTTGFPCVVHAGGYSDSNTAIPEKNTATGANHSFLALGLNPQGDILCWDKEGYGKPYRVLTLDEEYGERRGLDYWGIRKLREPNLRT